MLQKASRATLGWTSLVVAVVLWTSFPGHVSAQTLARPGWRGSGITTEPWWRSGVFYRIAPERFQDSDGDGVGDLRGVAERLDYLQALGVDALVLQLPFDDSGFDELFTEASRRHIRLVIGLDRSEANGDGKDQAANTPSGVPQWQDRLQGRARQWLSRGAAGILLPAPSATTPFASEDALRRSLCRLVATYPGERIVIASRLSSNGSQPLHLGAQGSSPENAQLILHSLPVSGETQDTPSTVFGALTQSAKGEGAPLLELDLSNTGGPAGSASESSYEDIAAAVLLTQRSAVLLEYGQELGDPAPSRMLWTPTNVTPPSEPASDIAKLPAPSIPGPIVYGPYRPYVPPPPKPKAVVPASNSEPAPPDPDTLPGFSTELPPPDVSGVKTPFVASVALQERDRRSLLNLYRALLALHHGNATLRNGSLEVVQESQEAVVWLRRAPAGAQTVSSVVVAVNCSDYPVALSLSDALARLRLRAGELRSLLPGTTGPQVASSTRLTLGAHGIFVGELTHGR